MVPSRGKKLLLRADKPRETPYFAQVFNLWDRLFGRRSAVREYRVPPGERVYAIGDVHGCAAQLDSLLNLIAADLAESELTSHLVFLGDVVDRGPASAQVIHRLCGGEVPTDHQTYLMGNHEEVMLDVYEGQVERLEGWLRFGGVQTLESYGIAREEIFRLGLDLPDLMREYIPRAHIEFMRGFADSAEIGDYLFVHAGIRPGIAIDEQQASDLRWIRAGFLDDGTDHGRIVVHGHTITGKPDVRSNRIGVDTGCYQSGTLTALVLEGADRRFLTNR